MLRHKILRDTLFLNVSNILAQLLLMVQAFLVLRFLEPEQYGRWLQLSILLAYSPFLSLGIELAMAVRIPYLYGQGQLAQIRRVQDTVYSAWTAVTLIASAAVIAYGLAASRALDWQHSWTIFVVAPLLFFEQQAQFFTRWQIAEQRDFRLFSKLTILRSVVGFAVIVPLTRWLHLAGFLTGTLFISGSYAWLWRQASGYRYAWQFSRATLGDLVRLGWPLLIIVTSGSLIETLDRMVVLVLLGTTSLGYYGVTSLGSNAFYRLLAQAGSAMSPHMAETLGRAGDSATSLERYLVKPTLLFATAAACGLGALMLTLPAVIMRFLPKYVPGLGAFYLFVPGLYFLAIIIGANNVLNVILMQRRRQHVVVAIQAAAMAGEIGIAVALIRVNMGISGAAFASTAAYVIYGMLILVWAAHFVLGDRRAVVGFLVQSLAPLAYVTLAGLTAFAVGNWLTGANSLASSALALSAFSILLLPLVIWLDHVVDLKTELGPFARRVWLSARGRLAT